MIKLQTIRQDDCTIGVLTFNGFRCLTLELPDRNNQNNISCIPAGLYSVSKITSPSLGYCLEIGGVHGRSYIRIHTGNYTSQIQGCVLVGDSIADINRDGVLDVTNSRKTFDALMALLPEQTTIQIERL